MQLGIIGKPQVGKTTVFTLLTKATESLHSNRSSTAIAKIPDSRVDYLSGLYKPRKITYAQLEIVDIPGLLTGGEKSSTMFLDTVRKADALLHVVRVFQNSSMPAMEDDINPIKDIELINYELLLADLDMIEKRIQRINDSKKKKNLDKELKLLYKLKETLESEKPLSVIQLDDEEESMMSTYQFLTSKPLLLCLNISEDDLIKGDYKEKREIMEYLANNHISSVEISAGIEKEIAELEGEERNMFMEEMGIKEAGIVRIARTVYESLGLISFFTVGEDEVKAWTIPEGTVARKAAGKIHSDIERGFIRAEVVAYEDLYRLGSMTAVREQGLFRLEGKEYQVQDGDIIHFRFNV